jgi:hypothetical protein
MDTALKMTLKSTIRMLGEAGDSLEQMHIATDSDKDRLHGQAQTLVVFAAARIENILAHLDQDIDVDHTTEKEQEYETLFKSAGL